MQNTKYPNANWDQYSNKIISALSLKKTAIGEYHGACPVCQGHDRFWIREDAQNCVMVSCRKCSDFAGIKDALRNQGLWPDENEKPVTREYTISWPEPEPEATHPYLIKKKIGLGNAKIDGNLLVIPVINAQGKRVGVQNIDPAGSKKFSTGMPVVGNFSVIGGKLDDLIYVCEGWATAMSVHLATGRPTVFALSAGNLTAVIGELYEARRNLRIIVAGDNDEAGMKAIEKCVNDHNVQSVVPDVEGWDFSDMWVNRGKEATAKALEIKSLLDQVFFPNDAVAQLDRSYLVKGWFGQGQLSMVYGASNVGKSFFVQDIAWHVSASQDWHGNKVKGGVVLFLALEGGTTTHNRIVALKQQYPEHKDVKLAVRPLPLNLLDGEVDVNKICDLCDEIKRLYGDIAMIVVDTLSRSMPAGDENSPASATAVISAVDKIRATTSAHLMLVHHSGKNLEAKARGHSSLRAAVETEIELSYDEATGLRTALATKQRDLEGGRKFHFKLKVIELGNDMDGDPVTTCVIIPASSDDVDKANKKAIKGKQQILFKTCFQQLRGEAIGRANPSGLGYPEPSTFWMIEEEVIKKHFLGKVSGVSNPSSTYKQAINGLISGGHIVQNEGNIWFTDDFGKMK